MTLSASVANGSSCKFTSKPSVTGLPATIACGAGTATTVVSLPANAGTTAKLYSFGLSVTGPGGTIQAGAATVTVNPPGTAPVIKHVSGALSQNTTWSPQDANVYVIDSNVTVPQDVTLTIQPGTVVKGSGDGITVVGGTLNALGTAAAPVVFTSIYDASAGGATDTSQQPTLGSWTGITIYSGGGWDSPVGGHLNLAYTRLSYATIQTPGGSGGVGGASLGTVQGSTVSLDHTTIEHAPYNLDLHAAWRCGFSCSYRWLDSITVTNSTFTNNNDRAQIDADTAIVTNNVFAHTGAIQALIVDSQATTPPRVEGNSVTGSGASPTCPGACGATISIRASQLDLSKLTGNTGTGNSFQSFGLEGDLIASGNLASVIPSGWTPTLDGEPYNQAGGLTIRDPVTLTIPAGTTIKSSSSGIKVIGGTLNALGTAAAPVVFTSIYDASAGGATDTSQQPTLGSWTGITLGNGTSGAFLNHTTLRYATTALLVADGANVTIHGAILDSTMGVAVGNSYVDATDVDWGAASGPAPIGSGTPISGAGVMVVPWVGYVAPTRPPDPDPGPDDPVGECKSVAFIGVRGSGDPQDDFYYGDPNTAGMGQKVADIYEGFISAHGSSDVRTINFHYPALTTLALGTLVFGSAIGGELYMASIWLGVAELKHQLDYQENLCSGNRIVLAGYSQGALVIHLALGELGSSPLVSSTKIAAVILLADPGKQGDQPTSEDWNLGDPNWASATANGLYDKLPLLPNPHIPTGLESRTVTACHNNDIVCAPGFGSWITQHTNYSGGELRPIGERAAALAG